MTAQRAITSLDRDEHIHVEAKVGETTVIVTDTRLAIASRDRLALDVRITNLRRIEFDIERERPATLVFVPMQPSQEPQVLAVQPAEYDGVAKALVAIGQRLPVAETGCPAGESG